MLTSTHVQQRGWERTGQVEGPVALAPSSTDPSELLIWADRAPANGAWVDAITAIDPVACCGGDRIALVSAWERLRRGMDAGFTAAVAAIAARPCKPEPGDPSCDGGKDCPHDWSREDTALALNLGRETARYLLDQSRELCARLPGLHQELASGQASFAHLRKAAARTADLNAAQVAAVGAEIAGLAARRTPGAYDRVVANAVQAVRDPAEVLAAHADALRAHTGIRPMAPMTDGLAGALLIGPAERIAALSGWCRQFTTTNRDPADPRTVGQRRLDALLAGVFNDGPGNTPGPISDLAVATTAAAPAPAGREPAGGDVTGTAPDRPAGRTPIALRLVLSANTLLGCDNEAGWLEGHGDLPAALARQLAIDPDTLQRLLVHPLTGHLLDLTPEIRTPGAALDRYIRARDGVCTGPGCGASTSNADLDHIVPVSQGGATTRANLHALCERSHRARHPGGWQVRRHPDDTETWTDPHGNAYRTEPTRYPTGQPPTAAPPSAPALPSSAPVGPTVSNWPDHDELAPPTPTPTPTPTSASAGELADGLHRQARKPPDEPCPF